MGEAEGMAELMRGDALQVELAGFTRSWSS